MTATAVPERLSPKDYASDQEVRWCPGCGDYAILKAMHRTMSDLGAKPENTVFVSGIGCAARFPYYMSTYGFHTIHGRAPAIATGVKLANPNLDVWVISGDGDALSIGANHTMHMLRRNVNLQFVLFNNEIYGLTKGQYSPTSRLGTVSPSTPQGSVDTPISACAFALGAGARFVARSIDTLQPHLIETLKRAYAHHGTSFVEVFQNCVVFNDGAFEDFTAKPVAAQNQIHVEHKKPLLFGPDRARGIRIKSGTLQLECVTVGDGGITMDDILVHDETDRTLAGMLVAMEPPAFPVAIGVLYQGPAQSYEDLVYAQVAAAGKPKAGGDLNALLRAGQTWKVE